MSAAHQPASAHLVYLAFGLTGAGIGLALLVLLLVALLAVPAA
jgi:hypothetical protein